MTPVSALHRRTSAGTPRRPPAAAGLALAAVLTATAVTAAACGNAAAPYPPTGVDQLTVPTPDPDPADFVAEVDNPWFPLAVGTTWTYEQAGVLGSGPAGDLREVEVVGTGDVDGVPVTEVRHDDVLITPSTPEAPAGTDDPDQVVDLFAQDTRGNVWWFGRDDVAFDEPGLWMPAEPRRGDGYRVALDEGLDVRAEVLGRADAVETPADTFADTWAFDVTSAVDAEPAGLTELTERYDVAEDIGVVRSGEWLLLRTDAS